MPESLRRKMTMRVLRSGGSPWLRTLVDKSVRVTEHATVANVDQSSSGLAIRLSNGDEREFDDVVIACGYRFDLNRLSFLSPEVRAKIKMRHGWPVLDRFFRSTDERVIFVGYAAEYRFGPLSRFVLGADFAANRVLASSSSLPREQARAGSPRESSATPPASSASAAGTPC